MNIKNAAGAFSILLLSMFCLSCNRDNDDPSPVENIMYPLKHISIQGLPSPYLQFIYKPDERITEIRQEANQYQYQLQYAN